MATFTQADRQFFRAAARAANDVQMTVPSRTHNFRNALVATIILLTAAAFVFPIAAANSDDRVLDLKTPSTSATTGSGITGTGPQSTSRPSAAASTPTTGSTLRPASASTTQATTAQGTSNATARPTQTGPAEPPAEPGAAGSLPNVDSPGMGLVATIELWGVLGALVGAVAGLRKLRGTTQPIGLQLAQLALKVPTGALTALVGVVLVQAALTPGVGPVDGGKVAAVAIVFGAAQEALTSFVDRAAGILVDKGKSLGEKTTD